MSQHLRSHACMQLNNMPHMPHASFPDDEGPESMKVIAGQALMQHHNQ